MSPSFRIYSSSAGSGKTYQLTKEYLTLALSTDDPAYFKRVLAITFTRDAASEMKERIVGAMRRFAYPEAGGKPDALLADVAAALDLGPDAVRRRAAATFRLVLYHYADFAVSTIDAFVQRIVTAFTRELDLPASFESEAKLAATIDVVRDIVENGEKAVVFAAFQPALDGIAGAFPGALVLDGSVPTNERQRRVDAFQNDPDARVFVANIVAGGVGITLTAATQVVFHDLVLTPADHLQAEDRAYRIGQTEIVNVTYVVGVDTIDDVLATALDEKLGTLSVFDGGASPGSLFDVASVLDEAKKKLLATIKKDVKKAEVAAKPAATEAA